MKLRWSRSSYTRALRAWSAQRVRLANIAVQKQRDAMPLFPEMVTDKTVSDRMQRMDTRETEMVTKMRGFESMMWRRARAAVRALTPEQRAAFLAKWNTGPYPATGCYVLTVLQMMGLDTSRSCVQQ